MDLFRELLNHISTREREVKKLEEAINKLFPKATISELKIFDESIQFLYNGDDGKECISIWKFLKDRISLGNFNDKILIDDIKPLEKEIMGILSEGSTYLEEKRELDKNRIEILEIKDSKYLNKENYPIYTAIMKETSEGISMGSRGEFIRGLRILKAINHLLLGNRIKDFEEYAEIDGGDMHIIINVFERKIKKSSKI